MTPLRQRMVEEMTMRNYSPKSIKLYVDNVARFARHFGKSPDVLGAEHVRQYLLYLIEDKKMAWGSYNQALAALRYFYRWVLKCEEVVHDVRMPRREYHLPTVLSLDETQRFMQAVVSFKYRMALMTAYSAGLRISETVNLLVTDIDSKRSVSIAATALVIVPEPAWCRIVGSFLTVLMRRTNCRRA